MPQNLNHEMIACTPHLPIYCSIYEDCKQLVPSHWHDHIEILFPLKGTLYVSIHEQEYAIPQHGIFIVNANDMHSTKSEAYIKVFMLQIPYSYLSLLINQFPFVHFHESLTTCVLDKKTFLAEIQQELFEMAQLFQEKEDGYELDFMSHLHHFFHILYLHFSTRANSLPKEPVHVSRIKEILSYIEKNYKEPLSLPEAAHIASFSQEYFCRIFKKYTGNTFLEYVNLVRLSHIYTDLTSTDLSITEILEQNGFTNYKVFSRMFKFYYGKTPTAFRQEFQKKKTVQ